MLSLAKDRTCLCLTMVCESSYAERSPWKERLQALHMEIQSITKKIKQEMGDKHTKKDKKTDVKIRWVLQLLTASKLAECLLRIHYSSYTEKYFGKDSEKKKKQYWCYIYPTKTTKCFVSCFIVHWQWSRILKIWTQVIYIKKNQHRVKVNFK